MFSGSTLAGSTEAAGAAATGAGCAVAGVSAEPWVPAAVPTADVITSPLLAIALVTPFNASPIKLFLSDCDFCLPALLSFEVTPPARVASRSWVRSDFFCARSRRRSSPLSRTHVPKNEFHFMFGSCSHSARFAASSAVLRSTARSIAPDVSEPTAIPTPDPSIDDDAEDCSRVKRYAFSRNVVMSTPNQFGVQSNSEPAYAFLDAYNVDSPPA